MTSIICPICETGQFINTQGDKPFCAQHPMTDLVMITPEGVKPYEQKKPSERLRKDAADVGAVLEVKGTESMTKFTKETGLVLSDPLKEIYLSAFQEGYGMASCEALEGNNLIINSTIKRVEDAKEESKR